MRSLRLALGLLVPFTLALLSGCGDEETIYVEETPVISVTVSANSTSIDAGGTVTLLAEVDTANKAPELQYEWVSEVGTFSNSTSATTDWIAPADPQLSKVSCIVTDKEHVGIGSIEIAVATYLPTDTPYYEGAAYCQTCHNGGLGGDQYATWSNSRHAHALATLQDIGQDHNPVCLACHTVGSNGLNADSSLDNRGYDDMSVEGFANVQCENCHGPASGHPSEVNQVAISLAAEMCGSCHDGEHHPTYTEWTTSGHGQGPIASAAGRASCAKCHNGLEGPRYLDDPAGYTNLSADPTVQVAHTCANCHDPHGNDNPNYLRDAAVTDIAIPNNILISEAGLGRLCIACHNGRRTETDVEGQIQNGSAHMGPHHSVQGDMLAGANAYEAVNPAFTFATSKHLLVEDGCVHCHTHPHDTLEGTFTGHSFMPTVEACRECHGELDSFEDVIAKQDYDGNGQVQGVQLEVKGLLDLLQLTVANAADPAYRDEFLDPETFETVIGDATKSTVEMRKASYNWTYVAFDGSSGVHNTTYSVQLLQQSILSLDPLALPAAAHVLVHPGE